MKWLILRVASNIPTAYAYVMSSFADLCFTTYLCNRSEEREKGWMISSKLTFTDRGIVNERIWHRSDGEDLGGNEKKTHFNILKL